jgi:hypothetical protein
MQKLIADARPAIEPKLKTLEESVRATLTSAVASSTPLNLESGTAKPPAKATSK